MFVLIRRRGSSEKIIFEDSDFDKCVEKRRQKMAGAKPSDELNIYRKQEYIEMLKEQEEKFNRYNEWNRKRRDNYEKRRRDNYEKRRKISTQRTQ